MNWSSALTVHRAARLIVALGGIGLASACTSAGSSSTSPGTAPPPPAPDAMGDGGAAARAAITIRQFRFDPPMLELPLGRAVVWTNQDDVVHTITSGDPTTTAGPLAGSLDGTGNAYTFTFTTAGTYDYVCSRHTFMHGEVHVH